MTYTKEQALSYGWPEDRAQAFADFMNAVDAAVLILSGITAGDLPDWDFASAFEAGEAPRDVAEELLEYSGFDVVLD